FDSSEHAGALADFHVRHLFSVRGHGADPHPHRSALARAPQCLGEGGAGLMYFESFSALWQMGVHGPYVGSAFGIGLGLIAANVIWALVHGRNVRRTLKRQLQRQAMTQEKP